MAVQRCTTADCGRIGTRLAFVEEAEPPDWYDYCGPCAALLLGEDVPCPNCAEAVARIAALEKAVTEAIAIIGGSKSAGLAARVKSWRAVLKGQVDR